MTSLKTLLEGKRAGPEGAASSVQILKQEGDQDQSSTKAVFSSGPTKLHPHATNFANIFDSPVLLPVMPVSARLGPYWMSFAILFIFVFHRPFSFSSLFGRGRERESNFFFFFALFQISLFPLFSLSLFLFSSDFFFLPC